jgi:hypothetical protein
MVVGNCTNLSPTPNPCLMLIHMNPLSNFSHMIVTAQSLAMMVNTRDNLHLRPEIARKSVASRLITGLIVLKTFLRRLIILIALELEWGLVDKRREMKRPHGRKSKPSTGFHLPLLDAQSGGDWLYDHYPHHYPRAKSQNAYGTNPPVYVDMARLYTQLVFLSKIADNPYPKAKRLAYHLARNREGLILAREGPKRIAGRWGTEIRSYYECLPALIVDQSRNRPPPLPPPRDHWPMITAL